MPWLSSYLRLVPPGLRELRHYRLAWLRGDVFAGLTVASLAVPQCLAAAQVAGVQPMSGLYIAVSALFLYAMFGSSRYIAAEPDPTVATIAAVAIAPLAAGDPARYAALAAAMALAMGALLIVAGSLRLGFLADLLPREVLLGYVNGIAITLVCDQLAGLAGIEAPRTDTALASALEAGRRLAGAHPLTLTVGVLAVALTLALRRWAPRWPGILLVTRRRPCCRRCCASSSAGWPCSACCRPGSPRPPSRASRWRTGWPCSRAPGRRPWWASSTA